MRSLSLLGCANTFFVVIAWASSSPGVAQITPDTTLPTTNSVVTQNGDTFTITEGTTAGSNLFHSFSAFSLPSGTALFDNATTITNIISRVTGGSVSNINGTIRANGSANLFFLNPNGIIFGSNAKLDIGGSFVASTADSIQLADGSFFSATNPSTPPLLTVSVPLGVQYGSNPGSIQVQGSTLEVKPGQSLALVGGNVSMDGGELLALGGRIEIGSVAAGGNIGLSVNGSEVRLSFPQGVPRSDVSLTNGALVNVRAGGGGSIGINTMNLTMAGRSVLRAGIASGSGSVGSQAGDVEVNATEAINLTDNSLIVNLVLASDSVGNGGDINISTGSLFVSNGSEVNTFTRGQGNAGTLNIVARDTVSLDDGGAYSTVEETGAGNAGGINITTGSLSVTNGARLNAGTSSRSGGNGGSVTINARDTVSFDGVRSDGLPTAALSNVENDSIGNAGDINITAGSLSVTNGAQLESRTRGQGNAGTLNINVRDTVSFDGAQAVSSVEKNAIGNGGSINITTGSLSLSNSGELRINTGGQGAAGKLKIVAQQLSLSSNAGLIGDVDPTGQGRGADINLDVTGAILLVGGETAPTGESTRITLGVLPKGRGSGGNLTINAGSLVLKDGAIIKISTQGQGNAGNVHVNADVVDISGSVPQSGLPSGIFTSTDTAFPAGNITVETGTFRIADGAALSARSKGDGPGGNITVNASSTFEAVNGGQLVTTTFGSGQAGNIFVSANDGVTISGSDPNYANRIAKFPNPISQFVANDIQETGAASGLFANTQTNSTAQGGDISITTGELQVLDGAQVSVNSQGSGKAGVLTVVASDSIRLEDQAKISADTSGGGGDINLNSPLILLRRGSEISTNARGINIPGGDIRIDTTFLVAVPKEDSDITANSEDFRGGNVTVNASSGIFGIEFRNQLTPLSDITAKGRDRSLSGTVTINGSEVDPETGVENLPVTFTDPSNEIVSTCQAAAEGNTFTITGRGGLPEDPTGIIRGQTVWRDLQDFSQGTEGGQASTPNPQALIDKPAPRLVEANSWVRDEQGNVVLIAAAGNESSSTYKSISPQCQDFSSLSLPNN